MPLPHLPALAQRTALMTPIGVERMGDAADALRDPGVLRLENLDTDLLPPLPALALTASEVRNDDANSYLPFFGHDRLRRAATALVARNGGLAADHPRVFSLDFGPDGMLLASGDWDQEIRLWDLRSGDFRTLKGHARPGHIEKGVTVRFSRDGTWLVSGGTDGTLRLWDVATGALLSTTQSRQGRSKTRRLERAAGRDDRRPQNARLLP